MPKGPEIRPVGMEKAYSPASGTDAPREKSRYPVHLWY